MKYVYGFIAFAICGGIGFMLWWWGVFTPEPAPRPKVDRSHLEVPPVAHSMQGQTFRLPNSPEVSVTLTELSPSATRDYPMGRFTTASTSGTITAHDDFASEVIDGRQLVPITVSETSGETMTYAALLEIGNDGNKNHTESFLLAPRPRFIGVSHEGSQVSLVYNVHARGQDINTAPETRTTAIVDVAEARYVQEGRRPWLEAAVRSLALTGTYEWVRTNGDTEVRPSDQKKFTLKFDGTNINLTTDCNSGNATYTRDEANLAAFTVGPIAQTKMFCSSSEEGPFFEMIQSIESFSQATSSITFTLRDNRTMEFVVPGIELEYAATSTGT